MPLLNQEPFVLREQNYLTVEPFEQLENSLIVGFSTRKSGFSVNPYASLNLGLHVADDHNKVIENRRKLADDIDMPLSSWVFSEQVHGNTIKKITKSDSGLGTLDNSEAIKGTDGLYTKEKNILLASLYADCVPLYFFSPTYNMVGLAHAGWKGTVSLIGPNMIRSWAEGEGIPVQSIYVAIGPSISQSNYEVDKYVLDKVKKVIVNSKKLPYKEIKNNKYLLDLKLLNKQLLIEAGVLEEHIFVSNYCTFNESDMFFSYRREERTGRMMSFIGMK